MITETAARGGRVLVPAFSVGRTQELVYDLHILAREGKIPEIPIYIDSPLAIDATTVFAMHPEIFDQTEDLVQKVQELFKFPLVRYTREASESKALNSQHGPMVIIAASGMAEAGRILHHLAHGASDPRNTILIVGFQAEHTLGRRIVERAPMLRVFGDEVPLRARVEVLGGYSAHGDRHELQQWLDRVRADGRAIESTATAPDVYLVHGEPEAQDAFAAQLRSGGYPSVLAPTPHQKIVCDGALRRDCLHGCAGSHRPSGRALHHPRGSQRGQHGRHRGRGRGEQGAAPLSLSRSRDAPGGDRRAHRHRRRRTRARRRGRDDGTGGLDALWGWLDDELRRGELAALAMLSLTRLGKVRLATRAAATERRRSAARTIKRLFTELDLTPRIPAALLADAAVAFVDGLALDVANGTTRDPRVSYDIFWLALLGLTE